MVLDAIAREYPNKLLHALSSDADVRPPRELTPMFFGCYDWHSAVHGHWTLVRLLRLMPHANFSGDAEAALERSFGATRVQGELAYLRGEGRTSFEVPYGMAWLLQLGVELFEWHDPRAERWATRLSPLLDLAEERLRGWALKLPRPVRTGEHNQSAFGMGLLLDWARSRNRQELLASMSGRAVALHADDRDGPLHLEPSGYDFLSPCLATADLMRRVLEPNPFAEWLGRFLPSVPLSGDAAWLDPVACPDPADVKLAHLDGLNLSRAWMLDGIASGLPASDPRAAALRSASHRHRDAGLAAVTGEHYAGSHWQGTFAVYLCTRRGLP